MNLCIHQTGGIFHHQQVSEILKLKKKKDSNFGKHHPLQDVFNLGKTSHHNTLALLYIRGLACAQTTMHCAQSCIPIHAHNTSPMLDPG